MNLKNNGRDQAADVFKCLSPLRTIIPPNEVKFTTLWLLNPVESLTWGTEGYLGCPMEANGGSRKSNYYELKHTAHPKFPGMYDSPFLNVIA